MITDIDGANKAEVEDSRILVTPTESIVKALGVDTLHLLEFGICLFLCFVDYKFSMM